MEKAAELAHTSNAEATLRTPRNVRLAATGGLVGALGVVSCCCLLPLVLLSLGVGGAWIADLSLLAPYKPALAVVTVALLGYGFYAAYRRTAQVCADGACAAPSNRWARAALWIASALFLSRSCLRQLHRAAAFLGTGVT